MKKKVRISPSIIAADYKDETKLIAALKILKAAKASMLHLDVMDGKFVPEQTFGAEFVQKMSRETDFLLDVHLMVANPEKVVDDYIAAGADIITIHYEATADLKVILKKIKSRGILAGVSVKLETDVALLEPYIRSNLVDMVLIMSVEPGACGRPFDDRVVEKIKRLKDTSSKIDIAVDGGINAGNISKVLEAGADIVVVGSGIFKASDPIMAFRQLKGCKTK